MPAPEAMAGETWLLARRAVVSDGGIVAAQHVDAAEAGAEILRRGGNAVDAAVACAFASGAVEPWNSGIGGGGQLVFAEAEGGKVHAVDFLPIAPAGLDPVRYGLAGEPAASEFGWPDVVEQRNMRGYEASCVPGTVDGLGLALERFGQKTLGEVLEPSIRLLDRGLPIDWYASLMIAASARDLDRFAASRAMFMRAGQPPLPPDLGGPSVLPLPALAATYRRLATAGRRDFYEGETADLMARDLEAGDSPIHRSDLATYRASVGEPVACTYKHSRISTAGGMSGGPMLIAALERLDRSISLRPGSDPGAEEYVLYASVLRDLFAERLATFGHAGRSGHTTSIAVADRDGNLVALTNTVGVSFGAKVVLPATGIVMNSAVNNFSPVPGGPNPIAPGRYPLLNICPAICTRDAKPWAAIGAAGGRRIIPAVAQLASFLVDMAMPIERAFATPRIDVSGSRIVCDARLPAAVRDALARLGPVVPVTQRITSDPFGLPSGVTRDVASGLNAGMAAIHSSTAAAVAEGPRTKTGAAPRRP